MNDPLFIHSDATSNEIFLIHHSTVAKRLTYQKYAPVGRRFRLQHPETSLETVLLI